MADERRHTVCCECGKVLVKGDPSKGTSHGLCVGCAAIMEARLPCPEVADPGREAQRALALAGEVEGKLRGKLRSGDLSGGDLDTVASILTATTGLLGRVLRIVELDK